MSEQLIEATMTYERDDGSRYRRTVTGDEAGKWKKMMDGVCVLAHVHGGNPDWRSVEWTVAEVKPTLEPDEER